jgi:hypothetical protein
MVSKVQFWKLGREGDETLIDGASPWTHKWEKASSAAFFTKNHPSYPKGYGVHAYKLTADGKVISFWAGKVEDGVWAFYRGTA